jgi:hypothetical protein
MFARLKPFQFRVAMILGGCALGLLVPSPRQLKAEPLRQLYHNEDCTNFFWFRAIPEGTAGETIDQYVDAMAKAGITVFLCNTNARRTNYRSDVWESFWDGYDPTGPDDQPFLAPIPRNEVKEWRRAYDRMLAVHQQGVDYPARVAKRCRHHGISPWISLRMNDCHENSIPDHPFHGSFWKNNSQFARQDSPGYYATCLDYAHPEVRDHFRALIVESLERYDIDGLELDFMREPYLFSAGKEAEGAKILTDWLREIRKLVQAAAAKRGHEIRLGIRVPSHPETALAMGFDVATWASEGLIDLLVVTPRFFSVEYDMPMQRWKTLLESSNVVLAGGLVGSTMPYWGEPRRERAFLTPELATGAAVSVLSRGADAVYLFNIFQDDTPRWPLNVYKETLKPMRSLDALLSKPRAVSITYRDIIAPGEKYKPTLPATGSDVLLPVYLGPVLEGKWRCELKVELMAPKIEDLPAPKVLINDQPCELLASDVHNAASRVLRFSVPLQALTKTDVQQISLRSTDAREFTVVSVEMSLN